nr:efflux RND transporter periplasmic adaptor subunit [Lachnospiraceae bacterium]
EVGDVLYTLTDDSISDIRDQMEADVESAKADMDSITADNTISRVSAKNTYQTAIAYGEYAQTEYDLAIQELNEKISDIEEEIEIYEEENETLTEDLAELQEKYDAAQYAADQYEYTVNHTDDVYTYVTYEDLRETYQEKADSYLEEIEEAEETLESNQEKLTDLQADLAEAQRDLESGTLKAKEQYNLRMLSYSTASEAYDISIASLDLTEKEQTETYEDAQEKLTEFDSSISGGSVIAEYAGTITEVPLAVGDTITTNTTLLTLYDQSETTITVSVSATDLESLELGGAANIVFTAYSDEIYTGTITEIGDSSTDSSGNITYEITVTIDGDTSGLFQDMTGDLTFITKETEEVVYVSNRAIFRSGTRSYVKMYDESGNIVEQDVTTGFSDGENVEIINGLSEGDVVLIEG